MKRLMAFRLLAVPGLVMGILLCASVDIRAGETKPTVATLRGSATLERSNVAPRIPKTEETDRRRARNYPEQPPTIPHKIDGYQLDMNGNQCLSCHARSRVSESGAPMISVTHFMDRDGQALAAVSPRRYFCNQCHVVQLNTPEAVSNTFVDIDSLLAVEAKPGSN